MSDQETKSGPSVVKITGVSTDKDHNSLNVSIVDIDMPFMSMVSFMVKWAIAAIPAVVILSLIATIAMSILAGLGGGR